MNSADICRMSGLANTPCATDKTMTEKVISNEGGLQNINVIVHAYFKKILFYIFSLNLIQERLKSVLRNKY